MDDSIQDEAEKYTDQPDMIISFYSGVAQFFFPYIIHLL